LVLVLNRKDLYKVGQKLFFKISHNPCSFILWTNSCSFFLFLKISKPKVALSLFSQGWIQ